MGKKCHASNSAFDVTDQDLEAVLPQADVCESAAVAIDNCSGQSRGIGFVEMSSNAEAQKAVQHFNGQDLKGRVLKVNDREDRGSGGDWNRVARRRPRPAR